jgi:hypothetical protein
MPCSTRAMMVFSLCICLFLVIPVFPAGCVCRTECCHKTRTAMRLSVHRLPVKRLYFCYRVFLRERTRCVSAKYLRVRAGRDYD